MPPRRIITKRPLPSPFYPVPRVVAKLSVAAGASRAPDKAARSRRRRAKSVGGVVHARFSAALELGRHQQSARAWAPSAARSICWRVAAPGAGPQATCDEFAGVDAPCRAGRPGATPIRATFHSASGPSQSSARSGQPAGDGATCGAGRGPYLRTGHQHRRQAGAGPRHRPSESTRASRRRTSPASSELGCGFGPGLGAGDQLAVELGELAVAAQVGAARRSTSAGGGSSATKWRAPAWWRKCAVEGGAPGRRARRATPAGLRHSCGRARSYGPARASRRRRARGRGVAARRCANGQHGGGRRSRRFACSRPAIQAQSTGCPSVSNSSTSRARFSFRPVMRGVRRAARAPFDQRHGALNAARRIGWLSR